MCRLLFLLVVFAYAAASPAAAIDYPWCANFADGAGANCGFTTYEQCMLTARGTGGYCAENPMYEPAKPAARSRPEKQKRRQPARN